ncbi:MAG: phytoene/squalene synthase family protein, partial [Microbacterium sp.]
DDDGRRAEVLDRIDHDLDAAAAVIPSLPEDCRRAVTAAHGLFAELAKRLRDDHSTGRVSVPRPVKARIAARAFAGRSPRRSDS